MLPISQGIVFDTRGGGGHSLVVPGIVFDTYVQERKR